MQRSSLKISHGKERPRKRDAGRSVALASARGRRRYAQAYEAEPARLRASTTAGQFTRSMEGRRAPFGRVLSRKFIGAAFTRKLTGSPDGRYESILFRTSFEHKATAAERVILSHESSKWHVVDYRVADSGGSGAPRSG